MTIGSRIEEILILKRRNFVRRNGVSCLTIGFDPDQGGKTEDSQRVIPIPQLLLDLGFVEWIRDLPENHGPLMFPDAVRRATGSDITSPFSKALNRILESLGLGDFDEDFYAMRKTLSSMLGARVRLLSLTDDGHALTASLAKAMTEVVSDVLDPLSASEQMQLVEIMRKI